MLVVAAARISVARSAAHATAAGAVQELGEAAMSQVAHRVRVGVAGQEPERGQGMSDPKAPVQAGPNSSRRQSRRCIEVVLR